MYNNEMYKSCQLHRLDKNNRQDKDSCPKLCVNFTVHASNLT